MSSVNQASLNAAAAPKAEHKPAPKKTAKKTATPPSPQPQQPDPKKVEAYDKARQQLIDLGFSLVMRTNVKFSEFLPKQDNYRLVKIFVPDEAAKNRLFHQYWLNPNLIVVDPNVPNGETYIDAWMDGTDAVLDSVIDAYAKKHGIDPKGNDTLVWEVIGKLASGDPEVIALAKEVKVKEFDQYDPLVKWEQLDPKIGDISVRFVNYLEFNPASSSTKIELGGEAELFIFDGNGYRVKSNSALREIIIKEAAELKIDLKTLTPKEAIEFTSLIVEKYLNYNYAELANMYKEGDAEFDATFRRDLAPEVARRLDNGEGKKLAAEINREKEKINEMGADEVLSNGKGVCRHYSQVFNAVFYALKQLDPNLANVYSTSTDSENHEWVMVLSVEEVNGSKKIKAVMIDPTADDADNIPMNNIDASDQANSKYSTAVLLLRMGRKEEFKKLFGTSDDPYLLAYMVLLVSGENASDRKLFGEFEGKILGLLNKGGLTSEQEFSLRNSLMQSYLLMGEPDKALEQLKLIQGQKVPLISEEQGNFFLAKIYLLKGDLEKAESYARKCGDGLEGKVSLADILFVEGKDEEALALAKEIDASYDYSEFKLMARIVIAQVLAKRGKYAEALEYIKECEGLCRNEYERFSLLLAKAKVDGLGGKDESAEGYYAQLMAKYPKILDENLVNVYVTSFDLSDIYYLAKVAVKGGQYKLASRIASFGMDMIEAKADSYLQVFSYYIDEIKDFAKGIIKKIW